MPESFNSGIMAVLDAAQDEAKRLGYGYVASEHLLLGLIREAGGLVAEVFASLAITLEAARTVVADLIGPGIEPPEADAVPLTPLSWQLLERAAGQARKLHASAVGQEHLLQAVIMEVRGETARVLTRLGSGPAVVGDHYVQIAGLGKSAARSIRVPPGPLGERLTDGYRKVVSRAYAEAWRLHQDRLGTGHLLLALAGTDDGPAAQALWACGVSLEAARQLVSEVGAQPPRAPGSDYAGLSGYTQHAGQAMRAAMIEAMRRRDRCIGTGHLLFGLLGHDNTAVRVLARLGCSSAAVRSQLATLTEAST